MRNGSRQHRSSVEEDIVGFAGWDIILDIYEKIKRIDGFDVAQVYSGAFLTGGRIMEVLTLQRRMLNRLAETVLSVDGKQVTREVIEVRGMPLEKRYKKVRSWVQTITEAQLARLNPTVQCLFTKDPSTGTYTRRRFVTEKVWAQRRPFDIPMDEVPPHLRTIHTDFESWLKGIKDPEAWVFPSRTKRVHISQPHIWKILHKYEVPAAKPTGMTTIRVYPHWLRGQRASCLITWNGLSMESMMEFMSWDNLQTARHYGRMGKAGLLQQFRRFE